jgi:hypothetical protein
MKKTVALFAMLLSLGAMANEKVELDSKEVTIKAASAVVVRTSKTPETVKINFLVPMENSVCERYETEYVYRTSGSYCGYDTVRVRVSEGGTCIQRNRRGDCVRWDEQYREVIEQVPLSCMVPEQSCVQYGTATSYKTNSMKIRFKKLPALGGSETDTFSITSRQKGYDRASVIYDVKPLETLKKYKVEQKKFLGIELDSYEVTVK